MTIRPCIIIPVYNHHTFIEHTLEQIRIYDVPVFLVDDGSIAECATLLRELTESNPQTIHLLRLDRNQGKGAAVMEGMRFAAGKTFTHALQIDADGQHNTKDIPQFLEQAKQNPDSVICGKPVYDSSVPKGRLYGRYLTHFWVWVETLSFDIKDSMCGFRVYPLAATLDLINKNRIASRMDFDIEILVRLYWKGLKIITVETPVIYPENGVSHFAMVKDNIRITKTHTRLVFAMLGKLPCLIKRKMTS